MRFAMGLTACPCFDAWILSCLNKDGTADSVFGGALGLVGRPALVAAIKKPGSPRWGCLAGVREGFYALSAGLLRQGLDDVLTQANALLFGGRVGVVVGDDRAHHVGAVGLGALLPSFHPLALVPLI